MNYNTTFKFDDFSVLEKKNNKHALTEKECKNVLKLSKEELIEILRKI